MSFLLGMNFDDNVDEAKVRRRITQSIAYYTFNENLWHWKAQHNLGDFNLNSFPHHSHTYIANLFGYEDLTHLTKAWGEREDALLKQLNGPHGYSIFMMMRAKKKNVTDENV